MTTAAALDVGGWLLRAALLVLVGLALALAVVELCCRTVEGWRWRRLRRRLRLVEAEAWATRRLGWEAQAARSGAGRRIGGPRV